MAIDNRLQVFNEEGQSVDYDILASDVKFLPDGKDLPTKLAEMQDEIDQAGQGDGTVTGVKVGSDTYEPTEGVVDLSTPFSGKVDKNGTDSLMSAEEHTKLAGIEAGAEKNIIKGVKANGASTNLPVDHNGVVELPPAGSTISPATASPSMDGTASVGSSDKYAREDHVHPHDSSKQNTLTPGTGISLAQNGTISVDADNTPTPNSPKPVTSGGVSTALQTLLSNIHIGVNGNWWVGPETDANNDTGVKARGVDGISISDPSDIEVVHNLDDEKSENFDPTSQVAVLGADMGKELADMIDAISGGVAASVQSINGKNVLVLTDVTTPAIIASVQSLNFGEVEYGKSKSLTFTVRGRWLNNGISINSGSAKVVCSPASSDGSLTTITATYTPTSDDETLSTNIVLSSTGAESITIPVTGAGVEQVVPVITLSPSTVNIGTESGTIMSEIINVKGSNLEGGITLAVSGSGLSLSAATVAKADAEAAEGKDITVTFDGSADVNGEITASTTGGSDATATVNGNVVTPFASGTQFNIGYLRYVLQSKKTAMAMQNPNQKPSGAVVIPASVNDYGITPINGSTPGEGATYRVVKIGDFESNTRITSVKIKGQNITKINNTAFKECTSLASISLPASLVELGEYALQQTSALKTVHIYAGNTLTIKNAAFNQWYGATAGHTDCHVYLHADTLPVIDPNAQYAPFPNFYGTLHLKAGIQLSGEWLTRCANATVVNDL